MLFSLCKIYKTKHYSRARKKKGKRKKEEKEEGRRGESLISSPSRPLSFLVFFPAPFASVSRCQDLSGLQRQPIRTCIIMKGLLSEVLQTAGHIHLRITALPSLRRTEYPLMTAWPPTGGELESKGPHQSSSQRPGSLCRSYAASTSSFDRTVSVTSEKPVRLARNFQTATRYEQYGISLFGLRKSAVKQRVFEEMHSLTGDLREKSLPA